VEHNFCKQRMSRRTAVAVSAAAESAAFAVVSAAADVALQAAAVVAAFAAVETVAAAEKLCSP
jgi:hypothetical protein